MLGGFFGFEDDPFNMFDGMLNMPSFGGFDFDSGFPNSSSSSSYYSSSVSYGNGSKPVIIEKSKTRVNNNGVNIIFF